MFDDAFVRKFGFESVEEFHRINATSDTSTPEKDAAYRLWQHEDGTKAGLLALHEQHGKMGQPKLASAEAIASVLKEHFGVDIRTVDVNGRKFEVTFDDKHQPRIICEWDTLPDGHTMNGARIWWVRKWETGQPLPPDLRAVAYVASIVKPAA